MRFEALRQQLLSERRRGRLPPFRHVTSGLVPHRELRVASPETRPLAVTVLRHGIASRPRSAPPSLRLRRSSSLPGNRLIRPCPRDGRDFHAHDVSARQRHWIALRSRTAFRRHWRLQRSSSLPRNRLHRLGPRDGRDLHARDAAL